MKITFIYTDYSQFNQHNFNRGVAILSSCLKKEGYDTGLIHISKRIDREGFVRLIKAEKPDLAAFSFVSLMLPQVKRFSLWVRELGIPAIHGGMHPTVTPEDSFGMDGVTAICRGEGEGAIVDFCKAMESGRSTKNIPNIWVKEGGKIYKNPCRDLIEDLDSLPYPDYELFNYEKLEESTVHKILVTQASRGCLYKCTYCCNHVLSSLYPNSGRYLRHYSVDRLLDEVEWGLEEYPFLKEVRFYDDTLTQDKIWFKEFVAKYKKRIGLPYSSSERVENVNEETARELKESGCAWLDLGIENGDDLIREKYMKRRMSDEQIVRAFSILQSHDIRTNSFNIIGMVGETPQTLLKTVKLNAVVNPFIIYNSYFFPFKGTKAYSIVREKKYTIDPDVSTLSEKPVVKLDTVTRAQLIFFYKYLFFLICLYRFLWSKFGKDNKVTSSLDTIITSRYFPASIFNLMHFGKEDVMIFLRRYPALYAFFRNIYRAKINRVTNPRSVIKNIYLTLRRSILYSMPINRKEGSFSARDIKSILVIRNDRIGDLVVSLGALKELKGAFPAARVSVLVRSGNEALLKNIPWIDEAILYDGFFSTMRLLRQRHFDLAIDFFMSYFIKSASLAHLSGAEITAGYDFENRGRFFNIKVKPPQENVHYGRQVLYLVRKILESIPGTEAAAIYENPYLEIPVTVQDRSYVESLLKEKLIYRGDLLIGIHPGGRYPSQRWPLDKFSRLADRLVKRYKAKIVMMGSGEEENMVDKARKMMQERSVEINGLGLDKLAALIARMELLICNNSGPLHIAVSLKVPTVSTMGPTDPHRWNPGGEDHIVIRKGLSCSPCNLGSCPGHRCMEEITIDDMEEAVVVQMEKILKTKFKRT